MNSYIARDIIVDIRQSIQGFCSCRSCGPRCSKICQSNITAFLMLLVFSFQLSGFLADQWVCEIPCQYGINSTQLTCIYTVNNNSTAFRYRSHLCALEISFVSASFFLICIGLLVCCQTCCKNMSLETLRVCFVCIIPTLHLVSGILNFCCCFVAMKFMSEHKDSQASYQYSFYTYLCTGSVTLASSVASSCGYVCMKSCNLKNDYHIQAGSDDAGDETDGLLHG